MPLRLPEPFLAVLLMSSIGCSGGEKDSAADTDTDTDTDTDADTDTDTDTDTDADTDAPLDPPEGDPATIELAGGCPMESDLGGFVVEAYEDYSIVDGSVADGVVPITVLELKTSEGDCQVLRRNNPYCKPLCEAGFTCDFNGDCIPYPEDQDLGTVSVAGLLEDVVMEPLQPGFTYFDTSLPNPAFLPGDLIELRMPDGVYGPVTLHGVGIDELVSLDKDGWVLVDGVDMTVHWQPPDAEVSRGVVDLSVNIDQHGNSPATVVCTFEDDGEGTVPGAVISALFDLGVSGFPSGTLSRRTADKTDITGGCMDFWVASPRTVSVDVDGYTPCFSDKDCPKGQECNLELQICE